MSQSHVLVVGAYSMVQRHGDSLSMISVELVEQHRCERKKALLTKNVLMVVGEELTSVGKVASCYSNVPPELHPPSEDSSRVTVRVNNTPRRCKCSPKGSE